jgi:hypothetical protein
MFMVAKGRRWTHRRGGKPDAEKEPDRDARTKSWWQGFAGRRVAPANPIDVTDLLRDGLHFSDHVQTIVDSAKAMAKEVE